MIEKPFTIENGWFSGSCRVKTYELEEMTGTKVRALYQRHKARDLFDLYTILTTIPDLDCNKVMESYVRYLSFVASHLPTYKGFISNMQEKLEDEQYLGDTLGLLRPGTVYDPEEAWKFVHDKLIVRLNVRR